MHGKKYLRSSRVQVSKILHNLAVVALHCIINRQARQLPRAQKNSNRVQVKPRPDLIIQDLL